MRCTHHRLKKVWTEDEKKHFNVLAYRLHSTWHVYKHLFGRRFTARCIERKIANEVGVSNQAYWLDQASEVGEQVVSEALTMKSLLSERCAEACSSQNK
jgi:hypothetical protein